MTRESMTFDVVIVGAGPAGLASAIRFKQLCQQHNQEYSVCVIDKGAEVGAHILSGAVLETKALDELLPDWKNQDAPINVAVIEDKFLFLTENSHFQLPTPPQMHNRGNYVISLSHLCRWLGKQAERLGVEIFPGFAAVDLVYDEQGTVTGIITGDFGVDKQGNKTANYQPGIELHAKQLLVAEGCRGSLTKIIFDRFNLRNGVDPQTYGLGVKELWQIDPKKHKAGTVIHSVGWPLDQKTYGGSFLYHFENNLVSVGFVVGLDYENPYLSPFDELQKFKTHPHIRPLFEGGQRISYGARAISEGGLQSLPKLTFPGGMLIGDCAGFLNVPKIKGTHTAMKSGMLAAETVFESLQMNSLEKELSAYSDKIKNSWLWEELHKVRNIRPGFKHGLWAGLMYAALDTYLLRGKAPWTLRNHADHKTLIEAKYCHKPKYPKPDGVLTFDKMSSVYISNTMHEENQPCHLKLKDPKKAIEINYRLYDGPEQYYCPAGVYEFLQKDGKPYLQINAANCVHCKTCDIKDPTQNIDWVPPEGGGGTNYSNM